MSWERIRDLDRRINERLGTTPEDIRRRMVEPEPYAAWGAWAGIVLMVVGFGARLTNHTPYVWEWVMLFAGVGWLAWWGMQIRRKVRARRESAGSDQ